MTDTYRMFVELPNGAKFRAQGDASEVRVDLDRFYSLLIGATKPTPSSSNGKSHAAEEPAVDEGSGDGDEQPTLPIMDGLPRVMLDRLFAADRNGTVSLRALPHGENAEADALLALIYGAARLGNEPQVTGARLMKAAQQSGLNRVERIDRWVNPLIGQFVTAAGFKKGRRYGLTNPGIRRAEEILTAILG